MSQENTVNPYDSPDAELQTESQKNDGREYCGVKKIKGGEGFDFFSDAWNIYTAAPVLWVAMNISMVLLVLPFVFAIAYLPVDLPLLDTITNIVGSMLATPLMAGLCIAAHNVRNGDELMFVDLFAGLRVHFDRLIGLGLLIALLYAFFDHLLVLIVGGTDMFLASLGLSETEYSLTMSGNTFDYTVVNVLVMIANLIITLAYWFAVPLIALEGQGVFQAVSNGVKGFMKNIWPIFLYGLATLVLILAAIIPFGLGLLILFPVMHITTYTAYVRIFTKPVAV